MLSLTVRVLVAWCRLVGVPSSLKFPLVVGLDAGQGHHVRSAPHSQNLATRAVTVQC